MFYVKLILVAIVLAALAAFGWKMYHKGAEAVRVEWRADVAKRTADALQAEQQARAKEQELSVKLRSVSNAYTVTKSRLATANRDAADSLQRLNAAIASTDKPGADTATPGGVVDPRDTIIGQCAGALVRLDQDHQRVAGKLAALQDYTAGVCVK